MPKVGMTSAELSAYNATAGYTSLPTNGVQSVTDCNSATVFPSAIRLSAVISCVSNAVRLAVPDDTVSLFHTSSTLKATWRLVFAGSIPAILKPVTRDLFRKLSGCNAVSKPFLL